MQWHYQQNNITLGGSFLDVDRIIFEEFMERGAYIKNEADKLMYLYSTIDRKRGTTKLYMVGNSISRVNPYIKDWDLDKIFRNLKQGEIKEKIMENTDIDGNIYTVKLAIEFCQSSGGKVMAIGNSSVNIDKGSWQAFPQPKLTKSIKEYKRLYRFGFEYHGFRFLCDYMYDTVTKDTIFFIYPYNKEFKENIIVFSDVIKQSKYWQRDIYNISIKNEKLDRLFKTFKENKIFYSDDLTGTDFKQAIDFLIKK